MLVSSATCSSVSLMSASPQLCAAVHTTMIAASAPAERSRPCAVPEAFGVSARTHPAPSLLLTETSSSERAIAAAEKRVLLLCESSIGAATPRRASLAASRPTAAAAPGTAACSALTFGCTTTGFANCQHCLIPTCRAFARVLRQAAAERSPNHDAWIG